MHQMSAGGVAPAVAADQAAGREWLQDAVRSSLVLVFAGSTVVFALFAAVGQILPRPGVEWIPLVDAATAVVLAVFATGLSRQPLRLTDLHILGYGFALYCIAHGLLASVMGRSPGDISFAAFLVVGLGAVAVYRGPTIVLMALAAMVTVATVAATGGIDWLIGTTILMATSVLLGVTILSARLRAYAQIEQLRAADQLRSRELAEAVRQLEQELAERQRAEAERSAIEARLQQVQSLDALGTLAGGVAHGMNNVLAVVGGIAELGLADNPPGTQAHQDFGRVLEAAGRGAALTRNLLGFARRGKVRHAPFAIDDVVREVVEQLSATAPSRIRFVLQLQAGTVVGDPGQISQALMNICLNAVEAISSTGTVRLRTGHATLTPGESPLLPLGGAMVTLEVTDDGVGMDDDTVAHAFEPFYSGRSASSGRHGLGLAMVFGTIRDHSGEVTLRSEVGRGTTVVIRLPEAPQSPEAQSHRAGSPAATDATLTQSATPDGSPAIAPHQPPVVVTPEPAHRPASAGGGVVLVVDDEPLVRQLLVRMLVTAGFTCEQADGGRAAVDLVSRDPGRLALVVLDVAMPEMDGAATFEAIRAVDPDVPILLASGYPKDRRIEDLLAMGSADFLTKPFLRDQLLAAVDRIRRTGRA